MCSFELFCQLEDLEWGPRQQAQQVDAKNENFFEISNVDAIKGIQMYLDTINIQRMWIQYMDFFQL